MDYLTKALADLVFAAEMIRNELSNANQSQSYQDLLGIVNGVEDAIEGLEDYIRDERNSNGGY